MYFLGNQKRNEMVLQKLSEFSKKVQGASVKPAATLPASYTASYPALSLKINGVETSSISVSLKFSA
jgi:hypothetical protein